MRSTALSSLTRRLVLTAGAVCVAGLLAACRRVGDARVLGVDPDTDLALLRRGQQAVQHRLDITRRVDQCQLALAGRRRLGQPHLGQLSQHRVPQQAVLVHRETVACRQRQDEVVGVVGAHGSIV